MLRVSSKQQLKQEDIPIQREECQNFLKKQPDWQFEKEYLEPAVSGYKCSIEKREVLQQILQDAKEQKIDLLLVYLSDRIGRKEDETPFYVAKLNQLGVKVWSVREGELKTREHVDKLINYIRFWQAEGESYKISLRVRDAQETMVRAGKFCGGNAPYGYRLEYSGEISSHGRALKCLVIEPSQACVVVQIYDYYIRLQYGYQKIAVSLNEQKVPAIHDYWRAQTIGQILQNPIYMGCFSYGRRQNSGEHPCVLQEKPNPKLAIVDSNLWEKAQQIRRRRNEKVDHNLEYATTEDALTLIDFLYCGYCKTKLTNGSKYNYWTTKDGTKHCKKVRRYRCEACANQKDGIKHLAYYAADEMETRVESLVSAYITRLLHQNIEEWQQRIEEQNRVIAKQQQLFLEKKLHTARKNYQTLENQIPYALRKESNFTEEQLSSLLKQEECEMMEYKKQIEEIQERESYQGCDFASLFSQCSNFEKKQIYRILIRRIEIRDMSIQLEWNLSNDEFFGNNN